MLPAYLTSQCSGTNVTSLRMREGELLCSARRRCFARSISLLWPSGAGNKLGKNKCLKFKPQFLMLYVTTPSPPHLTLPPVDPNHFPYQTQYWRELAISIVLCNVSLYFGAESEALPVCLWSALYMARQLRFSLRLTHLILPAGLRT